VRPMAWSVTLRGVGVLGVLAETTRLVWALVHEPVRILAGTLPLGGQGLDDLPFESALLGLCGIVTLVGWSWTALTSAAVVAHAVSGAWSRPGFDRFCPGAVRRIVLAACGVALTSTIATQATADPTAPPAPTAVQHSGTAGLAGLSLPDRVTATHRPGRLGPTVPVVTGDSLWAIAERSLPPDASDYQVTVAWRALYRANVEAIGTDPDLIFPGTRLRLPRRIS
jgi:hypothetical protein